MYDEDVVDLGNDPFPAFVSFFEIVHDLRIHTWVKYDSVDPQTSFN